MKTNDLLQYCSIYCLKNNCWEIASCIVKIKNLQYYNVNNLELRLGKLRLELQLGKLYQYKNNIASSVPYL